MSTTRGLRDRDEPITMLTAYDALTAGIVEDCGIDIILVGDSMGTTVLGYDNTLPVTLEEAKSRTAAVARGTDEVLVVADMPFLSVGVDEAQTVRNAGEMLKDAGADAVKLESGPHTVETTNRLTQLGIPVMAHLGLTPQHVNQLGGYTRQGTTTEAAEEILSLAVDHEAAGAFALVLEHVPANVASLVTDRLEIPTIGIGAGSDCDGQVLVGTDVMGLSEQIPPFAEPFGDLKREMTEAIEAYREAVESGAFPAAEHSHIQEDLDLEETQ